MKIQQNNIFIIGLLGIAMIYIGCTSCAKMNINDIGLKVLGLVKELSGNSVDLDAIKNVESPTMSHDFWTTLLKQHVTESGHVNYKGFLQDSLAFQKYLVELTKHPPGNNWSDNEQLAYWINAYNAFTVKLILDNYPLNSIKDISDGTPMINSPWDIKFFKIGNIDFDLNTIEHDILRKYFDEPRIHFAINCASVSCPKLRNEAFIPENIEMQMQDQASKFINDPSRNIINNNETKLSKIFNWFQSDFKGKSSLLNYIKLSNPTLNEANKVEYLDYNWALNE